MEKILISTVNELKELREELSKLKENISEMITAEPVIPLERNDFLDNNSDPQSTKITEQLSDFEVKECSVTAEIPDASKDMTNYNEIEAQKEEVSFNWAVVKNYHQKKTWWNKCLANVKLIKSAFHKRGNNVRL